MKLRDGSVDFLRGKRLEDKLDGLRHATNIGREVGSRWGVGDVMRWDHNEVSCPTSNELDMSELVA